MVCLMKSPFRQQVSEYDCVPTTFLNALGYLFERDDIPPLVIQRIYLFCLDSMASHKAIGHGTSGLAVQLLGDWLNEYSHRSFRIHADYCAGESVHLKQGNKISKCLNAGGVALLRVKHQRNCWHYVLGLSVSKGWLYCYDPYPRTAKSNKRGQYEFMAEEGIHTPNLKIACTWLDTSSNQWQYRLGSSNQRECLLLKRAKVTRRPSRPTSLRCAVAGGRLNYDVGHA